MGPRMRERRFLGVIRRLQMMPLGHVRVVGGLVVIPGLVVLGGFTMMVGRLLVVIGGMAVVLRSLVAGHAIPWRVCASPRAPNDGAAGRRIYSAPAGAASASTDRKGLVSVAGADGRNAALSRGDRPSRCGRAS